MARPAPLPVKLMVWLPPLSERIETRLASCSLIPVNADEPAVALMEPVPLTVMVWLVPAPPLCSTLAELPESNPVPPPAVSVRPPLPTVMD